MDEEFVENLELSVKASNALRSRGITSKDQFMSLDKQLVMSWKGIGVRTWREIQELQEHFRRLTRKADVYEQFVDKVNELNLMMQRSPRLCVVLTGECTIRPAIMDEIHAQYRYYS